MCRIIGAGQMAHHQHRVLGQGDVTQRGPFGRLHAQPIHAGVELNAEGRAGQGLDVAQHLVDVVDHRHQRQIVDHVGIARHMPGKDADLRPRTQRLAQGGAFLGQRHEEPAGPGAGQRTRHAGRTKTITVGLDHCRRFALGAGVERAPIAAQRVEIDCQFRLCHAGLVGRRVPEVKGEFRTAACIRGSPPRGGGGPRNDCGPDLALSDPQTCPRSIIPGSPGLCRGSESSRSSGRRRPVARV